MKILVVDDHPIVRLGIRELLHREFPDAAIGEADCGRQAIKEVRAQCWDVVLLDISMPGDAHSGLNGCEVLHELSHAGDTLPAFLIVSMHSSEEHVIRALRAGAMGYITKESAPTMLATAVARVYAGGVFIEPPLAERIAFSLTSGAGQPLHRQLSDREYGVLLRLASGQTVTEIADALHLSVKTISTYRARILDKTGLQNTAGLIRYALDHNLIQ